MQGDKEGHGEPDLWIWICNYGGFLTDNTCQKSVIGSNSLINSQIQIESVFYNSGAQVGYTSILGPPLQMAMVLETSQSP